MPGIIGISFLFRCGSGDVEPREAWRFLKWLGSEQTDDRSRVTMPPQISRARRFQPKEDVSGGKHRQAQSGRDKSSLLQVE